MTLLDSATQTAFSAMLSKTLNEDNFENSNALCGSNLTDQPLV